MKQSISTLILLLTLSFFVALVVVLFLVFYYGSPGTYRSTELLVSPKQLKKHHFTEKERKSGRRLNFTFAKIEYTSVDMHGKGWGRHLVSIDSYKQFYDSVKSVRSIPHVTQEIVDQFNSIYPSTLTIFAYPGDNEKGEPRIYQQVEFIDGGNYFRIFVTGADPSVEAWAYFQAPKIDRKVNEWFTKKQLPLSWNRRVSGRADGRLHLPSLYKQVTQEQQAETLRAA